MRDDLIGFVLGALDADEHEAIRQKLESDAELQRQIQLVERCLQPLVGLRQEIAPPSGLATRTCEHLVRLRGQAGACQREGAEEDASDVSLPKGWATTVVRASDESVASSPVGPAVSAWGHDRLGSAAGERKWTMADFVVAAGVCVAASCLFFPALTNSRYNMQLQECQNRLRELGTSLIAYSDVSGGYFPVIPPRGNLSFSGVYAAKLAQKGLVQDGRVFLCPAKGNTVVLKIPPLQDIAAAHGPKLVTLHRTTGGDYAYTLGYIKQGHLYGIRNRGTENVAVLSDAPLVPEQIRGTPIGKPLITTHTSGQNVLFADGRVAFLATRRRPGTDNDDLFSNDRGYQLAGLHADDSVLAPSWVSPLPIE